MTRQIRLPGFYIALVAMLFRALLPSGWMPNIGGAAGIPIVLCSVDGPVPAVLGPDGQPLKHSPAHDDSHQHDVCPFAAAPHFAAPVAIVVAHVPVSILVAAIPLGSKQKNPSSHSYTPQSPRGPPGIA